MSVRKGDQTEGKLQVLNAAKTLQQHSFQLCTNEKVYPKSKRWALAQPTLQRAIDAASKIAAANVTPMRDGPFAEDDMRSRHALQIGALQDLQELLNLIGLAKDAGYLGDRTAYWTQLVADTKTLLRKWILSDEHRFNAMRQA